MSAPFYFDRISYIDINKVGNDYVIGDIHGRYDLVYEALKEVNFDENKDRLFCVGDLIDRGKLSYQVLDFLKKPFVYAIRGNHEDILLELYSDINNPPTEEKLAYVGKQVGLDWWLSVNLKDRQMIIEALRKLPLVIEINTVRGNVGLIHADINENLSWNEFKQCVEDNVSHVIEESLWGRKRLSHHIEKQVEGIGRIYVGHTVQNNILKLANVVAIDTGAVFNQHLTISPMIACTQMIIDAKSPKHTLHPINGHIHVIEKSNDITPIIPFSVKIK